jgi:hypothetical protein
VLSTLPSSQGSPGSFWPSPQTNAGPVVGSSLSPVVGAPVSLLALPVEEASLGVSVRLVTKVGSLSSPPQADSGRNRTHARSQRERLLRRG